MVSHHAISGCNLRNGDLYGSGTISDYVSGFPCSETFLILYIAAAVYARLSPRGDKEWRRANHARFEPV